MEVENIADQTKVCLQSQPKIYLYIRKYNNVFDFFGVHLVQRFSITQKFGRNASNSL